MRNYPGRTEGTRDEAPRGTEVVDVKVKREKKRGPFAIVSPGVNVLSGSLRYVVEGNRSAQRVPEKSFIATSALLSSTVPITDRLPVGIVNRQRTTTLKYNLPLVCIR